MRMTFASLFTILFAFTSAFAGTDTAKKLVGEWKGTDETGETASLVFHEDGSAAMIQNGVEINGKNIGGKVVWRVDDSKDPIQLDLVMTRGNGDSKTLPMIVRFISGTKIEVRMSPDMETRPAAFLTPENQIVLTKQ